MSTRSRGCRRRSPCSSSGVPGTPDRPWAASPHCRARYGCCTPGPGTTRMDNPCCMRRTSPRTQSKGPARNATASAACTRWTSSRWSLTHRSPSVNAPSLPGRPRGTATSCATSWSPSVTTSMCRGGIFRRRTGTGSCIPMRPPSYRSTPGSRSPSPKLRSTQAWSRATRAHSSGPADTSWTRSRTRRAPR